jgi:hypothetical protein
MEITLTLSRRLLLGALSFFFSYDYYWRAGLPNVLFSPVFFFHPKVSNLARFLNVEMPGSLTICPFLTASVDLKYKKRKKSTTCL